MNGAKKKSITAVALLILVCALVLIVASIQNNESVASILQSLVILFALCLAGFATVLGLTYKSYFNKLATRTKNLEHSQVATREALASHKAVLANLERAIHGLQNDCLTKIASLESEQNLLEKRISTLDRDASSNSAEISTLNETIGFHSQKILQSENQINSNLSDAREEIEALNRLVTNLYSK